jgi:hypothetical protein
MMVVAWRDDSEEFIFSIILMGPFSRYLKTTDYIYA